MPARLTARTAALAATAAALLAAGCAAKSNTSAGSPPSGGSSQAGGAPSSSPSAGTSTLSTASAQSSSASAACAPGSLKTKSSGTLTVATDSPAYEPWFVNNKPSNGKGFESAVAYAVAKQLGFPAAKVHWVVAPFNSVIAPTPKRYDFAINEFSITAARAKAVDFSSGYYDVAQSIVALKKDKYASAKTVAALRGARLGAQQGTTSLDALRNQVKPTTTIREYPTNTLAVQALKNGQIDGLAVDLPTGLYVTAAQVSGSTIVGQLPVVGTPEQFGLVLEKGSALTSCVSKAVDALRGNGTLTALQKRWLTTAAGAPELH